MSLGAISFMGAATLTISMILLWVSTAGLGFAISTLIKQMRYAWAVPGILSAVLSAMAPVYWPATVLPNELLGVLLPTGAAGIIGQSALGIVRYGTISDYMDHTDWVRQALEMWDRRIVYY
ncbi:MAG: hypothetical protein ACP5I3_03110, partial [Thermoproteus sp.]